MELNCVERDEGTRRRQSKIVAFCRELIEVRRVYVKITSLFRAQGRR